NVTVNIQEGTVLSALIGSKNSILSEYGGEFIIDNNVFDIVDSRGKNRNFKILYGKNIASIKETIDDTDLATVLIPKSGDYRLPEYVIESPKVANYEKKYFKEVELNLNIWDGDGEKGENQITEEEAYTTMRETCNAMFISNKVDQPTFNYEIDL
ncbi:phage tail spike protein, partial [Clostridium beijerinckii]